ncbi:hypothetical protein AG1IA_09054 [Rhizoctonia solani AG-1 IA]|uniref:Uncharacterized protein n=1 Tax=Thanatephorus cucumeris (strain AG1-IA) TaxID=983506 RepID=L8WJK7_THACA|nr:hypothetical protein AG1IA_09054 [Rhizoctonia solani AG-1 IA]
MSWMCDPRSRFCLYQKGYVNLSRYVLTGPSLEEKAASNVIPNSRFTSFDLRAGHGYRSFGRGVSTLYGTRRIESNGYMLSGTNKPLWCDKILKISTSVKDSFFSRIWSENYNVSMLLSA